MRMRQEDDGAAPWQGRFQTEREDLARCLKTGLEASCGLTATQLSLSPFSPAPPIPFFTKTGGCRRASGTSTQADPESARSLGNVSK